ncbi:MAG: helix-turn-helix domain-containing protein [Actinobacteria bacterium]|nr:helix-turn-helix domain-containing protein [Actinomycetota bacterium]
MQLMTDPRIVRLDRASLRCLAHPLRARLLSALRAYGPATASGLAQRLGTNSGATSYHLRQLAEVGLIIEEEQRGTARERWWRAAHEMTSWTETDFLADPDDRAAADWLVGHHVRTKTRWLEDWLEQRHEWSTDWRAAADSSDLQVEVTPDQLRAMNDELYAVIERYRRAGPDDDGNAQKVMVLLDTFPHPEPRV